MIIDRRKGSIVYPVISGERKGLISSSVRGILSLLSGLYSLIYERRLSSLSKREKDDIGVPVISVGNITLGGTGKTPICKYLAEEFGKRKKKAGVATRGYGREGTGTIILRRPEDNKTWHLTGDEPILFISKEDDTVVAIDVDRTRAGKALVEKYDRDVVILDDGFQFITLKRDVDIVVIDAVQPFGFGKVFPAGLLREPIENLNRADLFWITKLECVNRDEVEKLKEYLKKEYPGKGIITSKYKVSDVNGVFDCVEVPEIEDLRGRKLLCLSGIGNSESFESMVEYISGTPRIAFRFTDHHPYGDGDLRDVEDTALKTGVDWIITTEKDVVRMPGHFKPRCKWLVMNIEIQIVEGHRYLEQILSL